MLALLYRISLPELRRRPLRYGAAAFAILLGVALFTAVRTAGASLEGTLRDTVDRIAGDTALEVSAGEIGIAEGELERVRATAGVRAAAPVILAVARPEDPGEGELLVLGVDLLHDQRLRRYVLEDELQAADPLALLKGRDSLIVGADFARRNRLRDGSRIALWTVAGPRSFTVRGVLAPRGLARAFGGNLAVVDIATAQRAFGRGRRYDRIDVALVPGTPVAAAAAALRHALGPGYQVEPPARRGRQVEDLLAAFSLLVSFSGGMALPVGLLLVLNAFAVSIAERRAEIGILRCLGASRGAIQALFLGESLALGLAGALAGAAAGVALARLLLSGMAAVVRQSYGVVVFTAVPAFEPRAAALAVLLGVAAAGLAGYLPARAAAGVDPALALQEGPFEVELLAPGGGRHRRLLGAALCLAGAVLAAVGGSRRSLALEAGALGPLFAGVVLLVPDAYRGAAAMWRGPLSRLGGVTGRLACDSFARAPRRNGVTAAALMLCVAFAVASACFSAGVRDSLLAWVGRAVNPDLMVAASPSIISRTLHFPESMGEELRRVPGVREVEAVRIAALDSGRAPALVALDLAAYLRRARPLFEQGDSRGVLAAVAGGGGLLVSDNFARRHRLGLGDRLRLDTPGGRQELTVAGVVVDYTAEQGTLILDRRLYRRFWGDDRVDVFELMLAPGASSEEVRRAIAGRFAGRQHVFLLSGGEFHAEIGRLANQFWLLTYVQLLAALAVAVLGVGNSLTISIAERRAELAVLRALGAERRRLVTAVLLEAILAGAVALGAGVAFGATLGFYVMRTVGDAIGGWLFPYRFPAGVVAGIAAAVLLASAAAAALPAWRAARAPIAASLGYE